MDVRCTVRFYLNDVLVTLSEVDPDCTVLEFLRLDRSLKGTKEGCAEGDCGACTVLVGRLDAEERLVYEAIDSCIRFVPSLDGTHVVTIEGLSASAEDLHPVQQAMVESHGSQCGFCTPGIVMALYAHWLSEGDTAVEAVERALQGNLCRCTGYGPVIRAARTVDRHGSRLADPLVSGRESMTAKLRALRDDALVRIAGPHGTAILPATVDDLAAMLASNPSATILAGGTDVGLWVTKHLKPLPEVVFLTRVRALQAVSVDDEAITLGAGMSYSEARRTLARYFPPLASLCDRIGGEQVRNAGTIGGNIANGSPIGDTPPPLIALGATLALRKGDRRRILELEDFFLDYGVQDREPGEFIEAITIPFPAAGDRFSVYKVSKRFDEDITSVLGAFRLRLAGGIVAQAVIAYGGMAAVPKRARAVEAALLGRPWTRAGLEAAMAAFDDDFRPLDDWRASAAYRMLVAKNLLLRFWHETTGSDAYRLPRTSRPAGM